ncbi:dynamin family protein [Pseudonocardia sp. DSM 110487]|uniref:dynamin family protein n=1 Tax=Pseudonocardia sp. DSM 110487 TaxID=2865833 RepID=UPI001C697067|nr:dynamin family protein [Pseudonocardia sp. DSM 110487]QYN36700.1 dynamin family protein [Pseudonocardia sp. DSM 110487]
MALSDAIQLVDVARKATEAYGRPDLTTKLARTKERLSDPSVRVLVVGEFKQGKSLLVNSLVSASVCPVDDDVATAVPTMVRHAATPTAALVKESAGGGEPERTEIPVGELARHVSESGNPDNRQRISYAEVGLPRALLAGGLVLVDTPGVGGLGSAHGAATMAAMAGADAVVLVSDAAQEYTKPELDFLATAMQMCPNVVAVLTKIDLYPAWRRIADLDRAHLAAAGVATELIPISSAVRQLALRTKNKALNEESGYPALVTYLRNRVLGQAEQLARRSTGQDILSVCALLTTTMQAELTAQENPEKAHELVAQLEKARGAATRLKERTARWQVTLNDAVADLSADIDHDLRDRLRTVMREAETLAEDADPADVWDQLAKWVQHQVTVAASANFVWANERAGALARRVAALFAEDGQVSLPELPTASAGPAPRVAALESPDIQPMSFGEKALSGLRGGYGGGLMFFMPLSLIPGLAIAAPFAALGGALLLGGKQVRDEKKRALQRRQAEAKMLVRKHIDEVQFQVGKDSKDMLRRTHRTLRDHFTAIAEEMQTSMAESVAAAQSAVKATQSERGTRIGDLKAEVERVASLANRARALMEAS